MPRSTLGCIVVYLVCRTPTSDADPRLWGAPANESGNVICKRLFSPGTSRRQVDRRNRVGREKSYVIGNGVSLAQGSGIYPLVHCRHAVRTTVQLYTRLEKRRWNNGGCLCGCVWTSEDVCNRPWRTWAHGVSILAGASGCETSYSPTSRLHRMAVKALTPASVF